jgi:putative ABC transport system substrate-binding protein
MKRRRIVFTSCVATLAGLAAPTALQAQAGRAKRLGSLALARPVAGFLEGQMKARGWEIGRDLVVIRRIADGDLARLPALAQELVAEGVDVILASGDLASVAAAKATSSIPIVMQGFLPIENRLAKSLARPGGNVTGVVSQTPEAMGKLLDLLRALQPGLKRLGHAFVSATPQLFRRLQEVAEPLGITVIAMPWPYVLADVDNLLATAERERVQALNVGGGPLALKEGWPRIRDWAVKNKVVTHSSSESRQMTLAFGPSFEPFIKLWFDCLDRVLRGANPADTPIQQPTLFEMVVNRAQLREMGLSVPQSVLIQATEVID